MGPARLKDRKVFDLARAVEQTVLKVLDEVKPGRNLRTNVVAMFVCGRVAC